MFIDIVGGIALGSGISLFIKFIQGGASINSSTDAHETEVNDKLKGLSFSTAEAKTKWY